jgi:hypothetical protein
VRKRESAGRGWAAIFILPLFWLVSLFFGFLLYVSIKELLKLVRRSRSRGS